MQCIEMYNALLHSIIRQRPTMACRIPIHIDAIRYVRATTQTTTKNDPENPSIIPCFVSLVFACPEMFSCWVINYGQSASYQSRLLSLWASYYDNVPTWSVNRTVARILRICIFQVEGMSLSCILTLSTSYHMRRYCGCKVHDR